MKTPFTLPSSSERDLISRMSPLLLAIDPTPLVSFDDALSVAVGRAMTALAAQTDGAISAALDRRLGAGNWTMESLAGRCVQQPAGGNATLYYLDGKPLVKIGLAPSSVDAVRFSHTFRVGLEVETFEP